jgi:hypothetical protein
VRTLSSCSKVLAGSRAGGLLFETLIAVALFSVVLLSSMAMVESGRRFSNATMQITTVEDLAQQMLFRMEHELASATGASPACALPAQLGAADTTGVTVSSTLGFPPRGTLLLDRGSAREERVSYARIASTTRFEGLTRGLECTAPSDHAGANGVDQLWTGLAEHLENQLDPAPADYDGIALEDGQRVYFRGDGTGFSYRVPVDPTGGDNPLNGDDLFFGAVVEGVPTTDGWVAVVFEAQSEYIEAATGDDLNEDGDTRDVFEVGQLRRLTWDAIDASRVEELGLGPTNVIQERCNRGGDLDGDGFADPLFLWNAETNLLHVRLFLLGASRSDLPVVRKVESVMFLRNEPEL